MAKASTTNAQLVAQKPSKKDKKNSKVGITNEMTKSESGKVKKKRERKKFPKKLKNPGDVLKDSSDPLGTANKLKLFKKLNTSKLKDILARNKKFREDSDTDESEDEKDDAAVKSYMDDFGFKKEEEALNQMDSGSEEEDEEIKEAREEKERIRLERLASRKRSKLGHDDTELQRTVCIDNVNVKTNKKVLCALLKNYGTLESIRFRNVPVAKTGSFKIKQIMNQHLNKNRTSMTAYAKFSNKEECQEAMKSHLTEIDGHHLLFRHSMAKDSANVKNELKQGCTVLVGGLDKDAEEEPLYVAFSACGAIKDLTLPRYQSSSKGVAFIAYKDPQSMASALELDGTKCGGKRIRVTKAVRKVKKGKQGISGSGKTGFAKNKVKNKQNNKKTITSNNTKSAKPNSYGNGAIHSRLGPKSPANANGDAGTTNANNCKEPHTPSTPGTFTGQKFDQTQKSTKNKRLNRFETKKLIIAKKLGACAPKQKAAA